MKKTLLSLAAVTLTALGSLAGPYATLPAEGIVDISLEQNAGGLGSIDIKISDATVNRNATGYVTLTQNGKTVMNIPASNERLIYCIDGMDKREPGEPHITFWNGKLAQSPYLAPGKYTVVIPRGFFITSNGEETPQQVYNYTLVAPNSIAAEITPAYGSTVPNLSTVTIKYPEGSTVTASSASPVTITAAGIGGDSGNVDEDDKTTEGFTTVPSTFSINGNVVTVTLNDPITTPSQVYVTLAAGGFTIKLADGSEMKSENREHSFMVAGVNTPIEGDYSVTPAPGNFSEFPAIDYSEARGMTTPWYGYFHVNMPKGLTLTMNKGFRSYLVSEDGLYSKEFAAMPDVEKTGFYLYDAGEYSTPADLKVESGNYYVKITGKIYCNQGTQTVDLSFGPYVVTSPNQVKYELSPAAGSTINELSEITITFPDAKSVSWNPVEWATISSKIIVYDYEGEVEGNKITFKFPQPLEVPGDYKLLIPSIAINVDGMHVGVSADYNIERYYVHNLDVTSTNGEVETPVFVPEGDYVNYWTVNAKYEESVESPELTFEIPSGYTSFAYMKQDVNVGPDEGVSLRIPGAELEAAGFVINETGVVPALHNGQNILMISYGSDDAYVTPTGVIVTVERGVVSVETIDAADAEASYYTLQGVKVANPEKGIYIKVVGNKASKVVL